MAISNLIYERGYFYGKIKLYSNLQRQSKNL